MKVAVINLIGNVGKSTVSVNMIYPRLGIPPENYISVETHNTGAEANGIEVTKMKGRDFGDIFEQLLNNESVLVDVGASNTGDFVKYLQQYSDSHEEIDLFLIPVTKDGRAQDESLKTVETLRAIGVDKKRIKIVFNRIKPEDIGDIEKIFAPIFEHAETQKSCLVNKNATILENDVFGDLRENGLSLDDIMQDQNDYRAMRKDAKTPEEKAIAIKMTIIKSLAKTAIKNLDDVYKVIFK